MWPLIMGALRTYAPYVALPFAAVIGIIGYTVEASLSDKYTPWRESVVDRRAKRMLEEELNNEHESSVSSLKNPEFVPKNIFEKNASPTLTTKF